MSAETWARISTDSFNVTFFAYLAAMIGDFHYLAFRRKPVWRVALALTVLGLGAQGVSLVTRGPGRREGSRSATCTSTRCC